MNFFLQHPDGTTVDYGDTFPGIMQFSGNEPPCWYPNGTDKPGWYLEYSKEHDRYVTSRSTDRELNRQLDAQRRKEAVWNDLRDGRIQKELAAWHILEILDEHEIERIVALDDLRKSILDEHEIERIVALDDLRRSKA